MTILEAIHSANDFLQRHTGFVADPDMARLVDRPGQGTYWQVVYGFRHFFPDAKVVDDGDYTIEIDDRTGDVSYFG